MLTARNHPFTATEERARISPFGTVEAVKRALRDHHAGRSIGRTRINSLKSMGLLPRADGEYRLGSKYDGIP